MPRKSVVRLTDRPDMTLDVYRGRKTTMQHNAVIVNLVNLKNGLTMTWPILFSGLPISESDSYKDPTEKCQLDICRD